MRWIIAAFANLVVLSAASPAMACPFCKSETGREVHAGIFNDQFLGNVLLLLLPFPVLLAAVALIYFDVSGLWRRHQARVEAAHTPDPLPTTGE